METSQATLLHLRFGEGFLDDHAGRVISNPHIAIVELVANSWDAGARRVDITWPEEEGGCFEIVDDGTGMAKDEFENVWPELNYNRVQRQGSRVIFPDSSATINRSAYGRNGKGRHSLFCFSDEYSVETWKNGAASLFRIKRSYGELPYEISFVKQDSKEGHGTKICCTIKKNYIDETGIQELLGSKFITDPAFTIYLNNNKINLFDLQEAYTVEEYEIPGEDKKVRILRFDSKEPGRISRHHGVAWWVNNRLVGEHSWKGFEGAYLDGRTSEAKRYTFIVEADLLRDEVKPDWTWFKDTPRADKIIRSVKSHILDSIQTLMQDIRRETKVVILTPHKKNLKQLSNLSKEQVGKFVDQIQMKCPTMTQRHLSNTIEILTNMELSRTGYGLLQQLVHLSPGDLDSLSEILNNWSITDARKVLDELQWRLKVIMKIESLVEDPETNELHELQPLFESGLWIFGPEYEGIQFTSNRSLSTVVKRFFGGGDVDNPMKRPDFVVLPDSSIGVYSSDQHDDNGEVCGIRKVLIVELKRGGYTISHPEKRKAIDYALDIFNSGKVSPETKIVCYVLGANIKPSAIYNSKEGEKIEVIPRTYSTVLRQAHARTFNLIEKIKEFKGIPEEEVTDEEIKEVLSQREIMGDFVN